MNSLVTISCISTEHYVYAHQIVVICYEWQSQHWLMSSLLMTTRALTRCNQCRLAIDTQHTFLWQYLQFHRTCMVYVYTSNWLRMAEIAVAHEFPTNDHPCSNKVQLVQNSNRHTAHLLVAISCNFAEHIVYVHQIVVTCYMYYVWLWLMNFLLMNTHMHALRRCNQCQVFTQ